MSKIDEALKKAQLARLQRLRPSESSRTRRAQETLHGLESAFARRDFERSTLPPRPAQYLALGGVTLARHPLFGGPYESVAVAEPEISGLREPGAGMPPSIREPEAEQAHIEPTPSERIEPVEAPRPAEPEGRQESKAGTREPEAGFRGTERTEPAPEPAPAVEEPVVTRRSPETRKEPTMLASTTQAPELATEPRMPSVASAASAEAASSASPASWNQAISMAEDQLMSFDQRMAKQQWEQAWAKAQLTAHDQFRAAMDQERHTLEARLGRSTESLESLRRERETLARQLESLRECERLSHLARMAQQQLQANAAMVAQLSHSQHQVEQELSKYQERSEALRKSVDQTQQRLADALAQSRPAAGPPAPGSDRTGGS